MPFETTVVIAGIVAVFAIFAAVVAWAEVRTRNLHRHEPAE